MTVKADITRRPHPPDHGLALKRAGAGHVRHETAQLFMTIRVERPGITGVVGEKQVEQRRQGGAFPRQGIGGFPAKPQHRRCLGHAHGVNGFIEGFNPADM